MIFKTRIRKTDKLFSLYVRKRDKWTCQRCGKNKEATPGKLDCSHYFSRRHENTRFDPDNCISLCKYCHDLWGHGEKHDDYKEFMIKRLGSGGFDMLEYRSNQYAKKDDKLTEFILNEMLKEQNENNR